MVALGLVADDAFAARLADMDLVSKSLRLRFDLDGTDAEKLNCAEALLAVSDGAFSVRSHQDMAVEFDTMCGGFLFLGIFLGLLFLLAHFIGGPPGAAVQRAYGATLLVSAAGIARTR